MTNSEIARLLRETAALIELTGGNAFRARALSGAARTIRDMETEATARLANGSLTDADGIGQGVAAHVEEILARGSFTQRDELLARIPAGLLDVLQVQGLGPKKVRRLWKELDVTSLDALEDAAASGALVQLSGFGAKTQSNVLENVRQLRAYRSRRRWADAEALAAPLLETLRADEAVARAEPAGALRRGLETVACLDLAVATETPGAVRAVLQEHVGALSETSERGREEATVLEGSLPDGLPLRVHLAPPRRFGTAWWAATGSPAHCDTFRTAHGTPEAHADEEALYAAAGLAYVPPALREDEGELEVAADDALPDLITTADLRGSLHNHSTYSDGTDTIKAMAEAARALGASYFGLCDHSQSLVIANGLSPARVRDQREEVRALNARYAERDIPFRIFHGIESDVLADGSLDYDEEVLAAFDFVVASVHQGFSMTEAEATERLVRAVENPYTTILGHPTGRLLLRREGYPVDHHAVLDACARCDVAVELNANPYRLDVDWRHLRAATDRGVRVAINPDAHATDQLAYVRYGVVVARKGWLTADQCLNALPLDAFADWLEARRPATA